jgi:hypothetical protein
MFDYLSYCKVRKVRYCSLKTVPDAYLRYERTNEPSPAIHTHLIYSLQDMDGVDIPRTDDVTSLFARSGGGWLCDAASPAGVVVWDVMGWMTTDIYVRS